MIFKAKHLTKMYRMVTLFKNLTQEYDSTEANQSKMSANFCKLSGLWEF